MRIPAFVCAFCVIASGCGSTVTILGDDGDGGNGGNDITAGSGGDEPWCEAITSCCDAAGDPVMWECVDGSPVCPPGATWPDDGQCVDVCYGPGGCGPDEYCDFPDDRCGKGAPGTCLARPRGCEADLQRVCTCSGETADNPCLAKTGGFDLDAGGNCPAPFEHFSCGPFYCPAQSNDFYCRRTVSDVPDLPDDYQCLSMPSCPSVPVSCACLAGQPCGDSCEVLPSGGLMLTCPGG